MHIFAAAVLAVLLAGCSTPTHDVALAGLDLADGSTLADLQAALPQDDRAALGTYALLHWPKSKFYCGRPMSLGQTLATTVGEAIEQTRAYERRLALAQAKARTTAVLSARAEETALINRMEQLVHERDMLFGRMGPDSATSQSGLDIKLRLEEARGELTELRERSAL